MTKKLQVDTTFTAEGDIRAIRTRIARDKRGAAAKWTREIRRQIESLEIMPSRYPIIPEAEDLGIEYCHILFGNYRTIYRVETDRVIVLRVIHGARLLDESLLTEK